MSHSTAAKSDAKPAKPRPDFPLFPHATGRWTKKVRGKFYYFGYVTDDPKGEAALLKWTEQKDDLLAGRTPRRDRIGLTVAELCNRFLTSKERRRDAGELAATTFSDYLRTCKMLTSAFGRDRFVGDLAAEDFESLRSTIAKNYGVHRLTNIVQRVRSVFKYAYENDLVEKPVKFGSEFKRPAKKVIRAHRQKSGERMFDANQIRILINSASHPLKAMIFLAINCGFGNKDCGTLPVRAIDLDSGWVDYPRPKTAVERRCPLWPETIEAIRDSMENRSLPGGDDNCNFVFLTKFGKSWAKEADDNPIAKEFRKLLDGIDSIAAKQAKDNGLKSPKKLYRRGVGFYALRHTFETIGGESLDQVAVDVIMGHVDDSMAAEYRERLPSDDRLRAVTDKVHAWLYPRPTVG